MNKIDTREWASFSIKQIFTIKSPKARSEKNYTEGEINYVSSGAFNNGIANHLSPHPDEVLDKGHCITVSPLDGSAFWQEDDFMGRGGSGASISMLYNDNLNKHRALFICSLIKGASKRFGYNDLLNGDNLKSLNLKIPVDLNNEPDWQYMESYMKSIEEEARQKLLSLSLLIKKCER